MQIASQRAIRWDGGRNHHRGQAGQAGVTHAHVKGDEGRHLAAAEDQLPFASERITAKLWPSENPFSGIR